MKTKTIALLALLACTGTFAMAPVGGAQKLAMQPVAVQPVAVDAQQLSPRQMNELRELIGSMLEFFEESYAKVERYGRNKQGVYAKLEKPLIMPLKPALIAHRIKCLKTMKTILQDPDAITKCIQNFLRLGFAMGSFEGHVFTTEKDDIMLSEAIKDTATIKWFIVFMQRLVDIVLAQLQEAQTMTVEQLQQSRDAYLQKITNLAEEVLAYALAQPAIRNLLAIL